MFEELVQGDTRLSFLHILLSHSHPNEAIYSSQYSVLLIIISPFYSIWLFLTLILSLSKSVNRQTNSSPLSLSLSSSTKPGTVLIFTPQRVGAELVLVAGPLVYPQTVTHLRTNRQSGIGVNLAKMLGESESEQTTVGPR